MSLELALSLLVFFLLLHNAQEVVAFGLSLASNALFLVLELLYASIFKVLLNLSGFNLFCCIASTSKLISFLSCSFRFSFVNLRLAIVGLLLKGKKSLQFLLLLRGNSNSLCSFLLFNKVLGTLVSNDLLLMDLFLLAKFCLNLD